MAVKPRLSSVKAVAAAEADCTRCPLYKYATHVVPGEGKSRARLMLVGEQPGDKEDKAAHPFVGPAGRMLDQALSDAGIIRSSVFVTNAVKHFKFEPRGKRRLHKRPNAYEIDRCRLWLDFELKIVKPRLVLALGATAIRSLAGRPFAVKKGRQKVIVLEDGTRITATIHPSYLLRMRDAAEKKARYREFVRDLKFAKAQSLV
jgi:DNA polymerase